MDCSPAASKSTKAAASKRCQGLESQQQQSLSRKEKVTGQRSQRFWRLKRGRQELEMAENGGNDEGSGTDSKGIEELSSKTLRIQNKRYYIDAKRNSRGTFVKLVEALPNGVKTRLSIPMVMVGEFRDKLSSMADFYTGLDPAQGREPTEDGALKSSSIRGTGKRVYLDLMENNRGIFLRVSVLNRGQNRHTIALPARGIVDIRNTLSEYLEEFGSEEELAELPDPQEMRVERKRFYFDCGRNSRGSFLRISEVTSNYRSSITIPRQGLQKFKNLVVEVSDKMQG